jgi:DNA-binding NarL/FixJ family response regulator
VKRGDSGLRASRFRFAGEQFLVMSVPTQEPPLPVGLPPAERDVARGILRGQSNSEIARARGTSVRTVGKQVASLFRRLRVGSRSELVSRLTALARTQ